MYSVSPLWENPLSYLDITLVDVQALNLADADLALSAESLPLPAPLGILLVMAEAATAFAMPRFLNSLKNEVSFLLVKELAVVVVPWKRLTSQDLPRAVLHCLFVLASGEPKSLPA